MTIALNNRGIFADQDGQVIASHGGHILYENGVYYLYGEDRHDGRLVSCYQGQDLQHWAYASCALSVTSPYLSIDIRTHKELIHPSSGKRVNIERPKVLKNPKTGMYVMWMHWENGENYLDARCAIATADQPHGPFTYRGSFNPLGHMSRDCTLFQDDDGTAYFISAARDNADLHIYRLSEDYLSIDEHVKTLFSAQYREAPAVCKRDGIYFLITSYCTGWEPNQGKYAFAESMEGRWSPLMPFGDGMTFDTQPAFLFTIAGSQGSTIMYVGDRWDPTNYHDSRYIFLPLSFPSRTQVSLQYADVVEISLQTGLHSLMMLPGTGKVRVKVFATNKYLAAKKDGFCQKRLCYTDEEMSFTLIRQDEGKVALRCHNGKFLCAEDGTIVQGETPTIWHVQSFSQGRMLLINDGLALTIGQDGFTLCTPNLPFDLGNQNAQSFGIFTVYA